MFHLRLKEYREHPVRLSDYLPWALLVAPGIVRIGCVIVPFVVARHAEPTFRADLCLGHIVRIATA